MNKISFLVIAMLALSSVLRSQEKINGDSVKTFPESDNVYEYSNFIICGQPDAKMMKWFKSDGFSTIINLRTENEVNKFKNIFFDEAKRAKRMGFNYINIPVSGYADCTPENLQRLREAIDAGSKTVIHCQSGGRASYLFVAYLISAQNYTVDQAIRIGKQMRFVYPLEKLLDADIRMDLVK